MEIGTGATAVEHLAVATDPIASEFKLAQSFPDFPPDSTPHPPCVHELTHYNQVLSMLRLIL